MEPLTLLDTVLTKRALLVTGKGGVGKTTVAAALARMAAKAGRRTLIAEISSDESVPSRVAEVFGRHVTGEDPVQLDRNLHVTLLTPTAGHRRFLEDVLPMKVLANAAMRSGAIRRFFAAAPAFGEMGVLYRLLDFARRRRGDGAYEYETVVVDLPATGHALALAQVPGMILRVIPAGPIGNAVREGVLLLGDKERTAALVVTLLEPLPLQESLELVQGILKYDVPFAGMLANRVVPHSFSEGEHDALTAALSGAPPMMGARLFQQASRARGLMARLGAELPHPLVMLPELAERDRALVEAAALTLASAEWRQPS
ncbi:MAG: ArsA-related P-loop ATPase [Myxococcaceae bacterium]